MRNTAFVLVGVMFLILQGNLFRLFRVGQAFANSLRDVLRGWHATLLADAVHAVFSSWSTPNLVLPLIVFAGVHEYSIVRGAALAFVLGYAFDLFATAPIGLFTFVSVSTFVLARGAGVRLAAQTVTTQIALAFLFALVHGVLVLVLLAIFGRNPYVPRSLVRLLLPQAISTALVAPVIFRIAQRIHQLTISVPRPAEGGSR